MTVNSGLRRRPSSQDGGGGKDFASSSDQIKNITLPFSNSVRIDTKENLWAKHWRRHLTQTLANIPHSHFKGLVSFLVTYEKATQGYNLYKSTNFYITNGLFSVRICL